MPESTSGQVPKTVRRILWIELSIPITVVCVILVMGGVPPAFKLPVALIVFVAGLSVPFTIGIIWRDAWVIQPMRGLAKIVFLFIIGQQLLNTVLSIWRHRAHASNGFLVAALVTGVLLASFYAGRAVDKLRPHRPA